MWVLLFMYTGTPVFGGDYYTRDACEEAAKDVMSYAAYLVKPKYSHVCVPKK